MLREVSLVLCFELEDNQEYLLIKIMIAYDENADTAAGSAAIFESITLTADYENNPCSYRFFKAC